MAVPVPCLHGSGLRPGRDQGRQRHLLDRLAEAAFRRRTASRHARHSGREGALRSGWSGPAPTAAATPTTPPWTPPCWRRRSASRCGVQYTRDQGTGWDPKGPASIHRARAAIDAAGNVIAYEFTSKGFSRVDVNTNGSKPPDTLAGHFRGVALKSGDNFGVPAESYEFANKRMAWETIPPLLDRASPLRSAHLRDPVGPQIHFASESFMDEVAAALERRSGRVPPAPRQGPARHRGDQGRGREGGLAIAAVAAEGPDRQQGQRPRHRLFATQRHALRHRRRSRCRSLDRQDLGAQVHGRPRLRPDHQSRSGSRRPSRAISCRA